MKITYTPELCEYMQQKKKTTIIVELVELKSDLDMTELHVYLADERTRNIFRNKKGYGIAKTEVGEVLFPPFPLQFEETVTFGLKSFLFVKYVTYTGIKV